MHEFHNVVQSYDLEASFLIKSLFPTGFIMDQLSSFRRWNSWQSINQSLNFRPIECSYCSCRIQIVSWPINFSFKVEERNLINFCVVFCVTFGRVAVFSGTRIRRSCGHCTGLRDRWPGCGAAGDWPEFCRNTPGGSARIASKCSRSWWPWGCGGSSPWSSRGPGLAVNFGFLTD